MDTNIIKLINDNKYNTAVEVGVREGYSTKQLIEDTCLTNIYGVDILKNNNASKIVSQHKDVYTYIIKDSISASLDFDNEYFDFIYIDANHLYRYVLEDLMFWYPKLKKGGIICGDDYVKCNNPTEGIYGIVDAVEDFCEDNGIDVKIINMPGINKETRKELSIKYGKELEDNLWLIHSYMVPPHTLIGRKKTEKTTNLNWYFTK